MPAATAAAAAAALPAAVAAADRRQAGGAQQRILSGVVLAGLVLLVLVTVLALTSASRNAVQVGATGQALMQSQRLAKAVSQALGGTPSAFAEVKESASVLAANTRSSRTAVPTCLPCRPPQQPLLDR
jgi:twitching motility protein PilJ